MAFTAKILSWRFHHLNILGCLLKMWYVIYTICILDNDSRKVPVPSLFPQGRVPPARRNPRQAFVCIKNPKPKTTKNLKRILKQQLYAKKVVAHYSTYYFVQGGFNFCASDCNYYSSHWSENLALENRSTFPSPKSNIKGWLTTASVTNVFLTIK